MKCKFNWAPCVQSGDSPYKAQDRRPQKDLCRPHIQCEEAEKPVTGQWFWDQGLHHCPPSASELVDLRRLPNLLFYQGPNMKLPWAWDHVGEPPSWKEISLRALKSRSEDGV